MGIPVEDHNLWSFISRVRTYFQFSRAQKHLVSEMAPFYKTWTIFFIVLFIEDSLSAATASDDSTSSPQNSTSSVGRDKRFLFTPLPSIPSLFYGKEWNSNHHHQCECNWSTHQGKRCRVKTGQGEWSEWGSSSKCSPKSPTHSGLEQPRIKTAPTPCGPDQLPCQAGDPMTQCFPKDKFCDGIRHCANGNDEPLGCRIKQRSLTLKSAHNIAHYGAVSLDDQAVCAHGHWGQNEARVVCRNLGYSEATKAIPLEGYFTHVGPFLISDVRCHGGESKLLDCPHSMLSLFCGHYNHAGVACLDPNTLTLKPPTGAKWRSAPMETKWRRMGNVLLDSQRVCGREWGRDEAQVVCNSLFQADFADKEDGIVPVIRAFNHDYDDPLHHDDFVMDRVRCRGDEKRLTDCSFVTYKEETCSRGETAGVVCAECTPRDLKDFVDSVKIGDNVEVSLRSLEVAQESFKRKCFDWDCGSPVPKYPEYCAVKTFFLESKYVLTNTQKHSFVSLKLNRLSQQVSHQFLRNQFPAFLAKLDVHPVFRPQLAQFLDTNVLDF